MLERWTLYLTTEAAKSRKVPRLQVEAGLSTSCDHCQKSVQVFVSGGENPSTRVPTLGGYNLFLYQFAKDPSKILSPSR